MAAFWEIDAHSAYDMFSKYKYQIVYLVFQPWFLSGNFFLVAPFPDHFLLVPFNEGIGTEHEIHSPCNRQYVPG